MQMFADWSSVLIFCWLLLSGVQKEKKLISFYKMAICDKLYPSGVWGFMELGAITLIKTRFYHVIGQIWPVSYRVATALCICFSVKMSCSTETTQVWVTTGSALASAHWLKRDYLISVRRRESSWGSEQTSHNLLLKSMECLLMFLLFFKLSLLWFCFYGKEMVLFIEDFLYIVGNIQDFPLKSTWDFS